MIPVCGATKSCVGMDQHNYVLTRLGFGLNIAPKAMTRIVETVLSIDPVIESAASNYIDDIYVKEDKVSAEKVQSHLSKYGLKSKPLERLGCGNDVRVLGLKVSDTFSWMRDGHLPVVPEGPLTRRVVHRLLGEWMGHFPVLGWLRIVCAFLQRCTAKEGINWDEHVSEETRTKVLEVEHRLKEQGDPAKGSWVVRQDGEAVVWTDASNLGVGVALAVDGEVIEDAAWLKRETDTSHINVSELDAAIRGINLAIKWKFRKFKIMTDSSTVRRWLQSAFERTHNVRTHALSELLIRKRLSILQELQVQENLDISVQQVRSEENLADALTRVPKSWTLRKQQLNAAMGSLNMYDEFLKIHKKNHFGVLRTTELAKEKFLWKKQYNKLIREVVRNCERCTRICPAKTNHFKGSLTTKRTWFRVSADITHVGGTQFLTVIDNASKYCVWRSLQNGSAAEVVKHLQSLFSELSPSQVFLSDNGTVFRSEEVKKLLSHWRVEKETSCAYRPQGNGISERNHRTIKTMTARTGNSVQDAVFWYNVTRGSNQYSPFERMFHAKPRLPDVRAVRHHRIRICPPEDQNSDDLSGTGPKERNPFVVGDQVYLRSSGHCDDPWSGPHRVTSIKSSVGVEINQDGVTRHVSHLRKVQSQIPRLTELTDQSSSESESADNVDNCENSENSGICEYSGKSDNSGSEEEDVLDQNSTRKTTRIRRRPSYLNDYLTS